VIGLFRDLLERLVRFAMELAGALVRGIVGAPVVGAKRMLTLPQVRRAGPDEVVDLRWKVLRPGRPREDAIWDGDAEPGTRHWVAEHDGRIVGVASVLARPYPDKWTGTPPPAFQLRGMATADEWRGHGVGKALLQAIVAEVGEPMWCNARESALGFYKGAGWRETSGTFDVAGIGPHRRMAWS
jgi:GNAT superfamily N-acetyltransferase